MKDLTGAIPVPKQTKIADCYFSGKGIAPADNLQVISSFPYYKVFK